MKYFNHNDYPLDTLNPSVPTFVSITGRWNREPHNLSTRRIPDKSVITVEIDGVRSSWTTMKDLNFEIGYTEGKSSGLYRALKRLDADNCFIAFGKKIKVIKYNQPKKNRAIEITFPDGEVRCFDKKKDVCEVLNVSPQYISYLFRQACDKGVDEITLHGQTYKYKDLNQKVEFD